MLPFEIKIQNWSTIIIRGAREQFQVTRTPNIVIHINQKLALRLLTPVQEVLKKKKKKKKNRRTRDHINKTLEGLLTVEQLVL